MFVIFQLIPQISEQRLAVRFREGLADVLCSCAAQSQTVHLQFV